MSGKSKYRIRGALAFAPMAAMLVSEPFLAFADDFDEAFDEKGYAERDDWYEDRQMEIPIEETGAYYVDEAPVSGNAGVSENAKVITGFEPLPQGTGVITVSRKNKPSLAELQAMMPGQLVVYTQDGAETIAVSWYPVGSDYETTDGYYYQFSPSFDTDNYTVDGNIDIIKEAPYIEVFVADEQGTGTSDGQAQKIDPDSVILNYSQSENKKVIFKFLTGNMGLNTAAACGVLANIYCESGFNPAAVGDGGTSYGICQWHNSRYNSLKNYCINNGYDYRSLEGQLNYLNYELSGSYFSTLKLLKSVFNDAEASYYAGYSWCYNFEKPKNKANVSITRGNLARDKYWASYSGETNSNPVVFDSSQTSKEKGENRVEIAVETENTNEKAESSSKTEEKVNIRERPANADLSSEIETETREKEEAESITVEHKKEETTEANSGALLSQNVMYLLKGGKDVALKTVISEGYTEYKVTYSSSDENIASVSDKGFVTPENSGSAVITAEIVLYPEEEKEEKDSEEEKSSKDSSKEKGTGEEEAVKPKIVKLTCRVEVRENDPTLTESPVVEFKTHESGPVKIGRYEKYITVKGSYESFTGYTGGEILPEDINVKMDISDLVEMADELSLIRKGDVTAEELFKIDYITGNNVDIGDGAWFYPYLSLRTDKADEGGLKRREIDEIERVLIDINRDLEASRCYFSITPIDISSEGVTLRLKMKYKNITMDGDEVANVLSLRVIDKNRKVFELDKEDYEVKLNDMESGLLMITITDEGNGILKGSTVIPVRPLT